ncbi:MAG TPA: winged helix-turn-helix domain-containing protein [Actinocrinis sp.]|jgi:DNA-binding transcriptional ArsR family regulator
MSTDGMTDRIARLEQQMQDAAARLSALEQASEAAQPRRGAGPVRMPGPGGGFDEGGVDPDERVFEYSGQGTFGRHKMMIARRAKLPDVLDVEPDQLARVFAALASPARVVLVRALLDGPLTSQELRARLDDPSVGQLYHHLNQLLAAGLVVQPGRSLYALPRGNEIALCIGLLAAGHLIEGGHVPRSGADEHTAGGNGEAAEPES